MSWFWRKITFFTQTSDFVTVLKAKYMANMCKITSTFSRKLSGLHPIVGVTPLDPLCDAKNSYATRIAKILHPTSMAALRSDCK